MGAGSVSSLRPWSLHSHRVTALQLGREASGGRRIRNRRQGRSLQGWLCQHPDEGLRTHFGWSFCFGALEELRPMSWPLLSGELCPHPHLHSSLVTPPAVSRVWPFQVGLLPLVMCV